MALSEKPHYSSVFQAPPSRKQKQIENTKGWIAEAYMELLETHGTNVTITALCKRAGVGRQTFYRHFDSCEAVLRYEADRVFIKFWEKLEAMPQEQLTSRLVFRLSFDVWKEYKGFAELIQASGLEDWIMDRFVYYRGIIEKRWLGLDEEDSYAFDYRVGGLGRVFLRWLKEGMVESPDDVVAAIADEAFGKTG